MKYLAWKNYMVEFPSLKKGETPRYVVQAGNQAEAGRIATFACHVDGLSPACDPQGYPLNARYGYLPNTIWHHWFPFQPPYHYVSLDRYKLIKESSAIHTLGVDVPTSRSKTVKVWVEVTGTKVYDYKTLMQVALIAVGQKDLAICKYAMKRLDATIHHRAFSATKALQFIKKNNNRLITTNHMLHPDRRPTNLVQDVEYMIRQCKFLDPFWEHTAILEIKNISKSGNFIVKKVPIHIVLNAHGHVYTHAALSLYGIHTLYPAIRHSNYEIDTSEFITDVEFKERVKKHKYDLILCEWDSAYPCQPTQSQYNPALLHMPRLPLVFKTNREVGYKEAEKPITSDQIKNVINLDPFSYFELIYNTPEQSTFTGKLLKEMPHLLERAFSSDNQDQIFQTINSLDLESLAELLSTVASNDEIKQIVKIALQLQKEGNHEMV